MEKLHILSTKSTPEILFSPEENIFTISGISSPEDVRAMYYPVIAWIKKFSAEIQNGRTNTFTADNPMKFMIDLSYFNSSSAKFLYDILSELKTLKNSGIESEINWIYEDNDPEMKDAGSDLAEIAQLKFKLIEKKTGTGK
ncbi:MAG: DUF1987 domain-containing protein [Methanosarcina sp.]